MYRPNNLKVGDIGQPCFTPMVLSKGADLPSDGMSTHTDIGIVALQCLQHFALNPNVGEMLPQLVPWDSVKCFAKVDEARVYAYAYAYV